MLWRSELATSSAPPASMQSLADAICLAPQNAGSAIAVVFR